MIKLIKGDCLEKMKDIPDGGVDMILCDLPYGTTNCKWDSVIDMGLLWPQYKRVLKVNGAVVLFGQSPFDKFLWSTNPSDFRYEWIWEKTSATGFLNAKRMPLKAHENILVFYSALPVYNPKKTTGHKRKVSSAKNRAACIDRNNEKDSPYNKQCSSSVTGYDSTERYPRSVVLFPSDKQKSNLHPTQKPVALMEYLIQTYTNEGDTVLDNCMGSGTTGVACKNLGRSFIGIEKDEKYFEVAKKRILEH